MIRPNNILDTGSGLLSSPFVQGPPTARDGTRLPPSALTAAVIHLPGASGSISLESLQVTDSQVSVVVADTGAVRATGTVSIGQTLGFLELTDAYGRPAGVLFGDLQSLLKMEAGTYLFDPKAAEFVPACLLPVPDTQVAGLQTPDLTTMCGDLVLLGGSGVLLSYDQITSCVVVDVVGDPYYRRKLCGDQFDSDAQGLNVLRRFDVQNQGQTISIHPSALNGYGIVLLPQPVPPETRSILRVDVAGSDIQMRTISAAQGPVA